jgi:hypothetical protein
MCSSQFPAAPCVTATHTSHILWWKLQIRPLSNAENLKAKQKGVRGGGKNMTSWLVCCMDFKQKHRPRQHESTHKNGRDPLKEEEMS